MPTRIFLARLAARGVAPAMLTGIEGCDRRRVDELVASPDFPQLVESAARLRGLDDDARRARLVSLAYDLLELALTAGDVRAGLFVIHESRQDRSAARTLADKVIEADKALTRVVTRAAESAWAPPPPGASRPRRRSRRIATQNDLGRQCGRAEADLVRRLGTAEVAAATAPADKPPPPTPTERRAPTVAAHVRKLCQGAARGVLGPLPPSAPATSAPSPAANATAAGPGGNADAAPSSPAAVAPSPARTPGWPRAP